jgi:4-amino-4-deoxy-L-arabinose transferase-like glycosyltransferase
MLAQRDDASERERRRWMLLAWAAAALAVLSKGLIGIVLPGAAFAVYIAWQRDWRLLRRLHAGPGLALFGALAVPWFVAVSLENPEFFRFFFIHEHFERFLTKVHGRYEPPWYLLPVLAVGIAPWLLALPAALQAAWRAPEPTRFRPRRWLLVWCVVVFAFFSASGSKLPSYILPIFPALAVLIGWWLERASRALLGVQAGIALALGIGLAAYAPKLIGLANEKLAPAMLEDYGRWVLAAGALLGAGALAALWLAWQRRVTASVLALSAAGLACAQLILLGHETLAPAHSAYHVVERARSALTAGAPFYTVDVYDHTMPFYLGRTVTMVAYRDELATPIGWQPQNFLPDIPAFAAAWRSQRTAGALFRADDFERIVSEHDLAAEVIARDARFVIARKPNL